MQSGTLTISPGRDLLSKALLAFGLKPRKKFCLALVNVSSIQQLWFRGLFSSSACSCLTAKARSRSIVII